MTPTISNIVIINNDDEDQPQHMHASMTTIMLMTIHQPCLALPELIALIPMTQDTQQQLLPQSMHQ